jgi:NtrC-family two-component system sensor histidine kinase KinB
MTSVLPALRKKIFRGYLVVVAVFGVVGTFLVLTAVFSATALTPRAIHRNYDSIEAARKMEHAWTALHFPQSQPERAMVQRQALRADFEKALRFARENVTEPGESAIVEKIENHWKSSNPRPDGMYAALEELTVLNERGMFEILSESRLVRYRVIAGVVLFFLVALVVTLLIVDSLSARLANPLRAIAEILRSKPQPGEKLKLPEPTSLEVRILSEELQALWNRVSRSDQINVEKIVKQHHELETLLDAVEDAIVVINAEGKISHVSERMVKLLGVGREHLVGKAWYDLPTPSPNYLKLRDSYRNRMEQPNASVIELQLGGSEPRSFAGRFREVQAQNGNTLSTIFLLHDITEVRQRDRLKAEFIGVLSHELKTPIQSLGTGVELLAARKAQLDSTGQTLLEALSEDVSRIRTVAQQLVQVGQLSEASIRVSLERRDLAALIPEWLKPFRILAQDRQVNLAFRKEGSHQIWSEVDSQKFPWVLSNLVSNAIRVAPENSTVDVLLTDRNGHAELKVTDTGPGIPEDVQKRMFEPYFQGGKRATRELAGVAGFLGLGLTIAKEITEAHHGRIEYHAVNPRGACFRVLLPLKVSS